MGSNHNLKHGLNSSLSVTLTTTRTTPSPAPNLKLKLSTASPLATTSAPTPSFSTIPSPRVTTDRRPSVSTSLVSPLPTSQNQSASMVASHVVSFAIAQIPFMSHSHQVHVSPSSRTIPSFGAPSKTYPSLSLPTLRMQPPKQLHPQRSNLPLTPSYLTTAPPLTPPSRSSPKRAAPTLPQLPSHRPRLLRAFPLSFDPTPKSPLTTMGPTTRASFTTHPRGASNSPSAVMLVHKRLIGSPRCQTSSKLGPR